MVVLETTNDNPIFCLFGLKLLFEAINDPDSARRINELYGFSQKDFMSLTAKYDVFSSELKPFLYSQLAEKEQAVQSLTEQVVEKELIAQSLTAQIAEKDLIAETLSTQVAEKDQVVQSLQDQMIERERKAAVLREQLVEGEQKVHILQTNLIKQEKEFKAVQAKIIEREQKVKGLTAQLVEQEQQVSAISIQKTNLLQEVTGLKDHLNQREAILQDLNTKLLEIYSSTAWKIIQFMWRVRLWLAPKGSKREKLGRAVIGIFRKKETIVFREEKGTPGVNLSQPTLIEFGSLNINSYPQAIEGDDENQPLVSVIIPCYNDGKFLNECLSSVYNQTYKSLEIVIVNDGSTDDFTNNLLKNASLPLSKILNIKHSGPATARNTGIKVANGKYILPLDADDKIHPTYIEKAVAILEEQEITGIVYCQAEYFGNLDGRWELPPYSLEVMLLDNVIFTTSLFRKTDWENVNGYDESLKHGMEDYDFWLSLIEIGNEVVQIPEVLFYYRIKDKSRTNKFNEKLEQVQDTYLRIYRNHPRLFSKYQDEYSIRLRNALIELVFLKRKFEESHGN
jgi:glycosyltransferase involved in cell wall biosynthesis